MSCHVQPENTIVGKAEWPVRKELCRFLMTSRCKDLESGCHLSLQVNL